MKVFVECITLRLSESEKLIKSILFNLKIILSHLLIFDLEIGFFDKIRHFLGFDVDGALESHDLIWHLFEIILDESLLVSETSVDLDLLSLDDIHLFSNVSDLELRELNFREQGFVYRHLSLMKSL